MERAQLLDHRARKQGLSAFGAFVPTSATIGGDVPQQVEGAWVSEDMFDVLGISVARGRPFTAADMLPGAPPTLILGHDFARARFPGGDAVGQSLMVDGRSTAIVGVTPRDSTFPKAEQFGGSRSMARSTRSQTYLRTMGRLADGATIAIVEQHMNRVPPISKQYPDSNAGYRAAVKPAAAQQTRSARRIITVLGLAAIAIFLLACTNIASLVVVRTAGRQSEFSVRTALGASAARLSRQLLIEHMVLAAISAVGSIGVVFGLRRLLTLGRLIPIRATRARERRNRADRVPDRADRDDGTDSGLGGLTPRRKDRARDGIADAECGARNPFASARFSSASKSAPRSCSCSRPDYFFRAPPGCSRSILGSDPRT